MDVPESVTKWLHNAADPSIRYLTLIEVLGEAVDSPRVEAARKQIPRGPRVRALLSGQRADGGFGVHPYQKWTGAHWRLVSLVELGIPAGLPRALAAAQPVLRWLSGDSHRRRILRIRGLTRRCASQEGNALAVCSRLGMATDPRVQGLAYDLVEWQWPDGGWNCDKDRGARHSSFHESLIPLWGLIEYRRAIGDGSVSEAIERAAELFLRHRLFRSERTSEVINRRWLEPHYPPYWHYDILQALLILSRLGKVEDPRAREALDELEERRGPDGRWHSGPRYWRLARERGNKPVEVVDWGRDGPNEMITLNALRVLKAAGRYA